MNDLSKKRRKFVRRLFKRKKGLIYTIGELFPKGIIIINNSGKITFANKEIENIFDLTTEEILGKNCSLVSEELIKIRGWSFSCELFPFHKVKKTNKPLHNYQCVVTLKDGKKRYLSIDIVPILPIRNQFTRMIQTITDETNKIQRIEEIERNKNVSMALAELSKNLLTTSAKEKISDLVLYYAKKFTNSNYGFVGTIDPQTGYLIAHTLTTDVWEECKVKEKKLVFKEFNGLWGWVLNNKTAFFTNNPSEDYRSSGVPAGHIPIKNFLSVPVSADGKLLGQIALANSERDYTFEDLSLLERLSNLFAIKIIDDFEKQKIEENQKKFKMIFNSASDLIFVASLDNKLLDANETTCKILGYEYEELLKLSLSDIFTKEYLNSKSIYFEKLNENESVFLQQTLISKTKEKIPVEVHVSKIKYNGKPAILKVARDVSFRNRIAQQEKLATVGKLAGGVAHDFNNILLAINGASETIKEGIEDKDLKKLFEIIQNQVEKGSTLISRILDFSGKTIIEPKSINLKQFIVDFSLLSRAIIRENVTLNIIAEDVYIFIDQSQLESILLNLLFNSLDAIEDEGYISIEIKKVSAKEVTDFELTDIKNGSYVQIIFKDNGHGIKEEHINRVFEPFYSTKPPNKGVGLGLSQVYGIVRQFSGYIDIKSEVDVGTEVSIFFPEVVIEEEEEKKINETIKFEEIDTSEASDKRKKGKILLVEDNDAVREVATYMLESFGFNVITAINGEDALGKFNETFNLVITDMIMPKMGGGELIKEIRKKYPDIRIIIITGYSDIPTPDSTEVLLKPFSKETLKRKVEQHIYGEV
ncbi:MAG: PAS domain S-box protein [Candidatus Heimdallarchaeaceae archaeon]